MAGQGGSASGPRAPLRGAQLLLALAAASALRPIGPEAAGPAPSPPLQFAPEDAVHAFYYLWYGEPRTDGAYRHWDHEVLAHWDAQQRDKWPTGKKFQPPGSIHSPYYPLLGPYSSRDPGVIHAHITELLDAGVNTIVVSWWGPAWRQGTTDTQGVSTDAVLADVVRELERHAAQGGGGAAMKLAFHMEPYPGRTASSVREDVADLSRRFGASPALLRVGGRPVYYLYDSYRIPAAEWAALLTPEGDATVRGTELDDLFRVRGGVIRERTL
ncbi:MAG: hypothetical protein J3K34DRAFT_424530 [Monoraphidium minutum]|nr:MAG: hypothetical protein J3K34DRAFT_424530 [Monoraphidium minutum]